MNFIENDEQFDAMQEALLREIVRAIRTGLGDIGIEPEKAFEATEKMTFSIAALLDGARPVMIEGEKVKPFLAFKKDKNCLLSNGGSSLHEMAFDVALEVCGDVDEAAGLE
ncbi:hypothetical protein [Methylomonas rhizoryzae]|uniref:hypothetical protein n=1 Tax=Methylomonas rhizoryzae TaxID=2608981 RepID=UPI0012318E8B|nr:hypothetical protein [Methylomonas rhizoryzae]